MDWLSVIGVDLCDAGRTFTKAVREWKTTDYADHGFDSLLSESAV